jgi:ATP-binding cassette subfamily B protein
MIGAAFTEIINIGAVLPLIAVLSDPARIFSLPSVYPLINALGFTAPNQLILPLTIGFGLTAILSGGVRLLLLWANNRLSFAIGADLSISIFRRTLYQPYAVHASRNSSEVISCISNKLTTVIFDTILPLLTLISSTVMLVFIMGVLFVIDPLVALSAFGGFGFMYGVIIKFSQARMHENSQRMAGESTNLIKSLQEGLGGIRDVLIDGSQEAYCAIYSHADRSLRQGQGNSQFIGQSPRYAMEALGMVLIATLAFVLVNQAHGITKAIPVLGALALGAQRLLPVLQQAYYAWSNIQAGQVSLKDALELLDQPLPDDHGRPAPETLPFLHEISINNLSFRYSDQAPFVLRDLDLSIQKGGRIGFIGATGSGKSTLLDIVMGLLDPTEGKIIIDGEPLSAQNRRVWQAHIAHVPQAIFLADSSIEENIAFGVSSQKIDHERVKRAAQQAQIADIIETWPKKYETVVGERGIRLSGGQRQRIGIARALYKQADVIIFDEATSALDNKTEAAVMQAIEELRGDLTLLIIAHRLSTLRNCDMIVELANGTIKATGTYEEIVSTSNATPKSSANQALSIF